MSNTFTNETLDGATQILSENVWTFRRTSGLSTNSNTLQNNLIRKSVSTSAVTTVPPFMLANPSGTNGIPKALLSASAVQSPSLQQDQMLSEVSVSFTRDGSDPNFGSARVWFTGYQGSSTPTLMASGTTSPITFLCQSTKETVVVSVQPVSPSGLTADLSFAISGTVTLSGVVSAPAAPSIAQSLVNTPTGYQFSFNFLTGLLTDVIANYRVYRNTSNTTVGATVIQSIAQDTNGSSSTYVVQDNIGSQSSTTYYYWVSAVNTSGLESSKTPAQSGTVLNGGWIIPPQYGTSVIIDNANFEASTVLTAGAPPGWVVNAAVLSYNTATPYAGAQSLKVVSSVVSGGAQSAKVWSCKPGDQFYVSAAQKSDGTAFASVILLFFDTSGSLITSGGAYGGTNTSWTIATGTVTAPAGAVTFYVRCCDTGGTATSYYDQILVDRMVDPATTVVARGSTPSSLTSGFTYTSTTTTVTVSWSGLTIYRADGTTTVVSNSSQLITGLSASTTYRVYPYYDELLGALAFVTGGVGSPAICQASGSNAISQAQNLQSRIPLSATTGFTVTTPASGSGGGSGGGSGSCLHESMLVESNRGVIQVIDAEIGDKVLGEHDWQTVTYKKVGPAEIFILIQITDGSEILCTPTHPFTMPEGSDQPMKRAQDLSLADFLITTTGVGAIKSIEVVETKARKVTLTVEPSHTFFAGRVAPTILTHNFLPS